MKIRHCIFLISIFFSCQNEKQSQQSDDISITTLKEGNGKAIRMGYKITGKTFLVSESGQQLIGQGEFLLDDKVTEGFKIVLLKMVEGQKVRATIPAEYLGEIAQDENPMTFVFEVEMIDDGRTVVNKQDSLILLELYQATNGSLWSPLNWDINTPVSEWEGVELSEDGSVRAIQLENNNLTGSLPESLSRLRKLFKLSLTQNKIQGEVFLKTGNSDEWMKYSYYFDENKSTDSGPSDSVRFVIYENTPLYTYPAPDSIYSGPWNSISQIHLLEFESPESEMTEINGFVGQFLPIADYHDWGKKMYAFSGYYTSLHPETERFMKDEMAVISGLSIEKPFTMNENGVFQLDLSNEVEHNIYFEEYRQYGIKIEGEEGWENTSESVFYNADSYSLEEMFLRALKIFPEDLDSVFYDTSGFPVLFRKDYKFNPNEWSEIEVDWEEDNFKSIRILKEDGCYEEYFLKLENNFFEVGTFAGC